MSYKYIIAQLNNELDWDAQVEKVKSTTSSVPYIVKRLKNLGFSKRVLSNVYRSYPLSHFNYRMIWISATEAAKLLNS